MIIIPGEPQPQLRPRARVAGKRVIMYDPPKSRKYKEFVKRMAKQQWPNDPTPAAISLKIDIYRPIPKSTSKVRTKKKEEKEIRPIVRPDVDNYAKTILDGLNGIVFKDDSQIVDMRVRKFYSINPRVEISVKELF